MSVSSRASATLSKHLAFLVDLLERRLLEIVRGKADFSSIFRGLDVDLADEFAKRFFGEGEFKLFGVDGSMATEEYLEMLMFYVCSVGYCGRLRVGEKLEVDVGEAKHEEALSLTASVPLWMDDLPNVSPQSAQASEDYEVNRSIESIAYALMRLAELSLAHAALRDGSVKAIIMDGLLSGAYGPLMRDFRLLIRGVSALEGLATPYGSVSKADLVLAGNLGAYPEFTPMRGVFTKYHLLKYLIKRAYEGGDWALADELRACYQGFDQAFRALKRLNDGLNGALLELKEGGKYLRVKPELLDYWRRVWWATQHVSRKIFEGSEEYPLVLEGHKWLTVLDINALNLFTLLSLLSDAVKKGVLIVGIAKDISATDFLRVLLPMLLHESGARVDLPRLQSDKAFLTMLSALHHERLGTPWRTVEYDYCLASMIAKPAGEGVKLRAARKVVGREQVFVKSYFQLRSSSTDPALRTPVFCYDRPIYPEHDKGFVEALEAQELRTTAQISPYVELGGRSPIGNLILRILSCSDNPCVIEEAGHNHLLFLADKYVKVLSKQAKGMLRGVASLGLGRVVDKYKAYFIAKRFRDLRTEVEKLREMKGAAQS